MPAGLAPSRHAADTLFCILVDLGKRVCIWVLFWCIIYDLGECNLILMFVDLGAFSLFFADVR